MDYLEGALLHSWWSDTDYESRRHTGTWLWFSFAYFLVLAYTALRLNLRGSMSIVDNSSFFFSVSLALFFVTPLICMAYYKLPFLLRVPALCLLGLKYICFLLYTIGRLAVFFVIPDDITLKSILVWGNETFGSFLENTTSRLGVTGLFVGGGILVLIGIGLALLIVALIIFAPILLLKGFNAFQFLWDSLVVYLIKTIRRLLKTYKSNPEPVKPEKTSAEPKNAPVYKT